MEEDKIKLAAVYGSLRRGFGNNRVLGNSKFLGEDKTEEEYTMYSLGAFPAIVPEGNTAIHIEVFEMENDATLTRLDALEGYPSFYDRKVIETKYGNAYIYFIAGTRWSEDRIVESGNWADCKEPSVILN